MEESHVSASIRRAESADLAKLPEESDDADDQNTEEQAQALEESEKPDKDYDDEELSNGVRRRMMKFATPAERNSFENSIEE